MTVISCDDFRFPASFALARSFSTESIRRLESAMNASPSLVVMSSFSLIIERMSGKFTSDLTLASQVFCSSSAVSAASLRSLFALAQRSASTISSGYVDAMNIWESSESG